MILVAGSLACLLLALYSRKVQAMHAFLVALIVLLVGYGDPQVILSAMANPVIFVLAALYVLVAAVVNTGGTQILSSWIIGRSESKQASIQTLGLTGFVSAFVNNSPVVAMLTRVIQANGKRLNINPSQWLLPISYVSILGGTCTLIGTSTNLIVDGMLKTNGETSFSLFELSWVGLPITLVGITYLFWFAPKLLPIRQGSNQQFDNVREYMVEMLVQSDSQLVGQTIVDAGLRNLPGLFLVEVERDGKVLSAVRPRTVLNANDRLIFAGSPETVLELRHFPGLVLADDHRFKLEANRADRRLFEAVLSPSNPMVGKTIKESRFRHRYSAVVLSVCRHGERLKGRLGDIRLQQGDTLLIEAQKGFLFRHRNSNDFLLVSRFADADQKDTKKAYWVLLTFATMVALVTFGVLSILQASLVSAATVIAFKAISFEDATSSIDYPVLVILACALGLGGAVIDSGLAHWLANGLLTLSSSPYISLVLLYGLTVVLTESISNNAAAVIMLPIALAVAEQLGVSHLPFAVMVMISASASFITPIGYQTNLMVMGPGGYHFSDYFKLGAPLSVLVASIALLLIPIIWPF